jgi:predicted ATPase
LWHRTFWDSGVEESALITQKQWRATYLKTYLRSFTVYHFHDTSSSSPMRGQCEINDNSFLRDNGSNLAAYLYMLKQTDEKAFRLIEGTIHSIAPYFKRFNLRPDPVTPSKISLEWEEVNSDMYLNGYSFSDGTIRFIALATLLLQSKLPEVIIIDEPELGLHPAAINKLAALIKRASKSSQIILSTQSTNLVNCFEPENIIVVDREDEQTVFKRLNPADLSVWMDEYNYSISDMWETNLIGGQL